MQLDHGGISWEIFEVPEVEFVSIGKEAGTHGKLYLVNDRLRNVGFVCQSIPLITKAIMLKLTTTVHNSSLYRIARGGTKSQYTHREWTARIYPRQNLEEFNSKIRGYTLLFFITKNPDLYAFKNPEVEDACQNSERTSPEGREPADLCTESQTASE